jgi:hypothetical protein
LLQALPALLGEEQRMAVVFTDCCVH